MTFILVMTFIMLSRRGPRGAAAGAFGLSVPWAYQGLAQRGQPLHLGARPTVLVNSGRSELRKLSKPGVQQAENVI